MTQEEAHKKVKGILKSKLYTKKELAPILKMKIGTLLNRWRNGDWRQKEINEIEKL